MRCSLVEKGKTMREKLIELLKDTRGNAAWHRWGYEEAADHLIANGVTIQRWIPVSERLPDADGNYIVFEPGYIVPAIRVLSFAKDGRKVDKYDFDREWKNVWYRYDSEWGHITIDDVTHWMPLPQPPKEGE